MADAKISELTSATTLLGPELIPVVQSGVTKKTTISSLLADTTLTRPSIRPSLLLDFANSKALDPRITFSRASTGSYYDGITTAKAEENLLTYSQEFDNAAWTKTNATVTANSTTAPDGTSTADTVDEGSAASANHNIGPQINYVAGLKYSASVFAKNITGQYVFITCRTSLGNYAYALFDLSTGVVTASSALGSGVSVDSTAITSFGGGWYRCVLNCTLGASATGLLLIGMSDGSAPVTGGYPSYTGTNRTIYLWGAQLEQRSAVTSYTPTTSAPITNYIPVLQTAAAGVARFDHNPTTGESLGLLIEEQRTNVALQSEDFGTTWSATRGTLSTNSRVSPSGTLTADKLIASADTDTHFVSQTFTGTAAAWTFSVFAKAVDLSVIALRLYNGTSQVGLAYYNLSTGAVGTVTAGAATITSVGDGWYRCTLTGTLAASASCTADIQLASADNVNSFAGNTWNGLSIWGAQLEAGAFATSYIPTTSAVTRAADSASITGANFTSWFNNGEGSIFTDARYPASNPSANIVAHIYAEASGANSSIYCSQSYQGLFRRSLGTWPTSPTTQWIFNESLTVTSGQRILCAAAWATDNVAASRDGLAVLTDTAARVPDMDKMQIGAISGLSQALNGTIKKIAYWPKRLSNTELQGVTA